jgi:hypothetical protein
LDPGLERDLLVRKLFTSGSVATTVTASAWSATTAVLKSVWLAPSATHEGESESAAPANLAVAPVKLAARSLVVLPRAALNDWTDLAIQRREVA